MPTRPSIALAALLTVGPAMALAAPGADASASARTRILAYVEAHPDAADTVEGVCRVWLAGAEAHPPIVRRVLDQLVEAGSLSASTSPGGSKVYRRRPHRPVPR